MLSELQTFGHRTLETDLLVLLPLFNSRSPGSASKARPLIEYGSYARKKYSEKEIVDVLREKLSSSPLSEPPLPKPLYLCAPTVSNDAPGKLPLAPNEEMTPSSENPSSGSQTLGISPAPTPMTVHLCSFNLFLYC